MTDMGRMIERLSTAFNESPQEGALTIGELAADMVAIAHVPARATDAPITGGLLGRGLALEWSIFEDALDDFVFTCAVFAGGPDTITLEIRGAGAYEGADGTVASTITLGVADGKITSLTSNGHGDTDANVVKLHGSAAAAKHLAALSALIAERPVERAADPATAGRSH
jgi:hypothetical protein